MCREVLAEHQLEALVPPFAGGSASLSPSVMATVAVLPSQLLAQLQLAHSHGDELSVLLRSRDKEVRYTVRSVQCSAMQCSAMQCNAMQCSAM